MAVEVEVEEPAAALANAHPREAEVEVEVEVEEPESPAVASVLVSRVESDEPIQTPREIPFCFYICCAGFEPRNRDIKDFRNKK